MSLSSFKKAIKDLSILTIPMCQVANLPLVIKERDVKYQFSRIVLYRKLLHGYPFKRPLIWKEARMVSFLILSLETRL